MFFVRIIPPGRRNGYDGEFEYWVVVKETAKRTEESSYEEEHRKKVKAYMLENKSLHFREIHL